MIDLSPLKVLFYSLLEMFWDLSLWNKTDKYISIYSVVKLLGSILVSER